MEKINNLDKFANKLYDKLGEDYSTHDLFAPEEYGGYRDGVYIDLPGGTGYINVTVTTLEVLLHICRFYEPVIFDGVEYSSCNTKNEVIWRILGKIKEYSDGIWLIDHSTGYGVNIDLYDYVSETEDGEYTIVENENGLFFKFKTEEWRKAMHEQN